MKKTPDYKLLAQYLSGECSDEVKQLVETWLQSNPENQKTLALMESAWSIPDFRPHEIDVESAWMEFEEKVNASLHQKKAESFQKETASLKERLFSYLRPIPAYRLAGFAAAILLIVMLPFLVKKISVLTIQKGAPLELQEIVVDNGGQSKITLSDGTDVTLDAGSSFSYPEEFERSKREVFLSGEGFFEVAQNGKAPFIVYAHNAVVKVLGTKFNVRAWKQTQKVKVAVLEGKVSLRSEGNSEKEAVLLEKNQMSFLPENGNPTAPQTINVEKLLSWLIREMDFEDAPLRDILHQLERWCNIKITVEDESLLSARMTMHIPNHPVESILDLIGTLIGLEYKISGNTVIFKN